MAQDRANGMLHAFDSIINILNDPLCFYLADALETEETWVQMSVVIKG